MENRGSDQLKPT